MTPRWRVRLIAGLVMLVIAAGLYFPALKRRVKRTAQLQQQSEEQARRELTQPLTATPTDRRVKAKLFWSSGAGDGSMAPVVVELPLSADPVLRAKQVLNTLLAGPVDAESRTLPTDAVLLAFYLLPDGTGIADFSETLATSTPSGIESEQMAVDSITKTLEANVPQVQRLKILIHGQEVDSLAGHLDLTGTFVVNTKPAPTPAAAPTTPTTPAPPSAVSGAKPPAAKEQPTAPTADKAKLAPLTPASAPGKLSQPGAKP